MRTGALFVALLLAVAVATPADAAKKRRAAGAAADPAIEAQMNSRNFFMDALHPWAPTTPAPKARATKKKKKG